MWALSHICSLQCSSCQNRTLNPGARSGIEPATSWTVFGFITAEPQWELLSKLLRKWVMDNINQYQCDGNITRKEIHQLNDIGCFRWRKMQRIWCWTQVLVPDLQWSQTNQKDRVWRWEKFIAGQRKENNQWLQLKSYKLPSGFKGTFL